MRGDDRHPDTMFSYVAPEQRVPADHPLRAIRTMVDTALRELSPEFARLYPKTGRPSIPPEQLLRALLLQMLYSVRSERQLMEQLDYNLLFRWFVGLSMDDPVWDPTVFTKNRERLLRGRHRPGLLRAGAGPGAGAPAALGRALHGRRDADRGLGRAEELQEEGDGEPAPPDDPGNPTVDFHGERRSNATHASTTDPEARLARKGRGQRSQARVPGARPDGEPPRLGRRHLRDAGHRDRGAGGGRRDGHEPAPRARPSAPTRATTPAASSPPCGVSGSRRTSRRISRTGPVRSTRGRRDIPATPSVSRSGSWSKRSSAGSRRWPSCGKRAIGGCGESGGCSPWAPRCTTWCASGT